MGCGTSDRVTQFKLVITAWVLFASILVGVSVWWFVSWQSAAAVDDLAWRMTGVVRTLSLSQAVSFFDFPVQAVTITQVADLNSVTEIQLFASIAYDTTNADVVKVGIENEGGYIGYTSLAPTDTSPHTIEVSSTLVNGTWTRLSQHAVVDSVVTSTPFGSRAATIKTEEWYVDAVAAGGTPVWNVYGDLVPIITFSKAIYNPGLTGVVASDLVLAKFITQVIDFIRNVSPRGEIYIATLDGVPLVASSGLGLSVLVEGSLGYLRGRAGGSLDDLEPMPESADRLSQFQTEISGDYYYVVWERLNQGDLELLLVMVLSRDDIREEIESTYRSMGLVMLVAVPVLVCASFIVSMKLVGVFVGVIRKSLIQSLQGLSPEDGSEIANSQSGPDDEDSVDAAGMPMSLDQTPMASVVGVLKALRSSLPSHDQWMLDKVVHKLVHSRAADLFAPHMLSGGGDADLQVQAEGIFSILRSATDQQLSNAQPGTVRPGTARTNKVPKAVSTHDKVLQLLASSEGGGLSGIGEELEEKEENGPTVVAQMVSTMEEIDALFADPNNDAPPRPLQSAELEYIARAAEGVDSWDFDIFAFNEATGSALSSLVMLLMSRLNLIGPVPSSDPGQLGSTRRGLVSVDWDMALKYFQVIEAGYFTNITYHTMVHAADTVHGTHYCMTRLGMHEITEFTPLDQFTLLFSAAVHDFRHVGVNNNFLVATAHPLAVRYNDKSVLENFHVASAFQLMDNPNLDILCDMENSDKTYVRNLAINIVLATDLAMSYDVIGKFKLQFCKPREEIKLEGEKDINEAKQMLLKMAMKCCDVSSGTKPFRLHNIWTNLVTEEFFRQGDMERDQGMPVASFMDRTCCDLPKSQQGFLNFVVKPIYAAMVEAFPDGRIFMDFLRTNISLWKQQEEAAKLEAKAIESGDSLDDGSKMSSASLPSTGSRPSRLPSVKPPPVRSTRVAPDTNWKK